MKRRSFLGLLAGLLGMIAYTPACNFSSVYSKIQKYVPVALQGFAAVLNILSGAGIALGPAAPIAVLVTAAFNDISAAINAYENAPADQKSTLLGKISLAITVAIGNINQFWSDLNLPDPKMAQLVQGLLGALLTPLAGFRAQLPAPVGAPVRATPKTIRVQARILSPGELKKQFNSLLEQNGYGNLDIR